MWQVPYALFRKFFCGFKQFFTLDTKRGTLFQTKLWRFP
jgi:hypothetical protein